MTGLILTIWAMRWVLENGFSGEVSGKLKFVAKGKQDMFSTDDCRGFCYSARHHFWHRFGQAVRRVAGAPVQEVTSFKRLSGRMVSSEKPVLNKPW